MTEKTALIATKVHPHPFDMLDYDRMDNTERGHCPQCGGWYDTETGEQEEASK